MVKRIDTEKPVLEIQLSGSEGIPRTRDLVDMLKEWYDTYSSLIQNVGKTEDLFTRTEDVLKLWGRIDA
jgi:hypothetical protein